MLTYNEVILLPFLIAFYEKIAHLDEKKIYIKKLKLENIESLLDYDIKINFRKDLEKVYQLEYLIQKKKCAIHFTT